MEKKEMTKSQVYAIQAADAKLASAKKEFQDILNIIAVELKVDVKNENWALSKDMRFIERQMVAPKINLERENDHS